LNVTAFEVRAFGGGFSTVTGICPGVSTSAAVIAAVNLVLLTNVVGRAVPFQLTTEPVRKPVP
jgi:hypothetical protein